MFVYYLASESVSGGHTAGNNYSIDFVCSARGQNTNFLRKTNTSLSGSRETIINRMDKVWSVTATWIQSSDLDVWIEFFDSVASGTTFTFDYGFTATYSSQDTPISVKLNSDSYQFTPLDNIGNYYSVSFEVIEV